VQVIDELRKRYASRFVYLVIGDGPDQAPMQELIEALRLQEFFKFVGYSDDISLACAASTVFLIAGVEDLVGIAGLQAASVGVPVLSFQIDPHWKSGEDLFFNSRLPKVLAEELARLMSDPEHHRRESARLRELVQARFTRDQMTSSYARVFREYLAEPRVKR
jgi:glycosyltransferase involved in cell wall biosynthesis